MNNASRLLFVLHLLTVLPACIALPLESGGEEPFSDERLAFIQIGESTKDDIATAMPWPTQFKDGNLWLYARTRQEAKWWLVVISPSGVGEATTGGVDYRFLVVNFNDIGVVSAYETSSSNDSVGCNRAGVCKLGSEYMMIAPEETDRAVKQFDNSSGYCGVYVYGKRADPVQVSLDDQQVGWLIDNDGFVFKQLDHGQHQLNVANRSYVGHTPIELTCVAGRSIFFEIKTKSPGLFGGHFEVEVTQRDASEGRRAVDKRKLMLGISGPME